MGARRAAAESDIEDSQLTYSLDSGINSGVFGMQHQITFTQLTCEHDVPKVQVVSFAHVTTYLQ
jgi:hypothetical protein